MLQHPLVSEMGETLLGVFLSDLFAFFIIAAAASILPLSTAYSVCEAFGWERGVNHKWNGAPVFYSIYTLLIAIGALVALIPGATLFLILVLVYDLNGILLPVLLVLLLRLANDRRLLGNRVNGSFANTLGIATSAILIALTALLLAGPLLGLR